MSDAWSGQSEAERTKWRERCWLQVPAGRVNARFCNWSHNFVNIVQGEGLRAQTAPEEPEKWLFKTTQFIVMFNLDSAPIMT